MIQPAIILNSESASCMYNNAWIHTSTYIYIYTTIIIVTNARRVEVHKMLHLLQLLGHLVTYVTALRRFILRSPVISRYI